MLYADKENLLELYNGLYDKILTNADEITINTLSDKDGVESGVFMRVKNDVSFVFYSYLNLFEHQSTINNSIPLRMLLYVARLIYSMVSGDDIYSMRAVRLPAPRFVVFYNGTGDMPSTVELKLSDQYEVKQEEPDLDLKVTVYNINSDKGTKILGKSRTLREYTVYVERTRDALKDKKTDEEKREAMSRVIDECIADGILAEFLTERRDEIMEASIFQYDQAAHERALYADGYDEGDENGFRRGMQKGMQEGLQQGEAIRKEQAERITSLTARVEDLEAMLGLNTRKKV